MNFAESPVSITIFLLTLGLSLYTLYKNPELLDRMLLKPYRVIHNKEWHRIITSGFIHGDMMHLMFNMLTFYFFAFMLESIIGSLNFLIIYLGSLVIADITSIIKRKNDYAYSSLGASGAISGVLFCFILIFPDMDIYLMLIPIGIPSPIFGLLYLAYCYYAAKKAQDHINHEAHLWGAFAGIGFTAILMPEIIARFFKIIF